MSALADLRVVFMGTPDFAVPSLEKLFALGCDVVGVVSQENRPKGRGQRRVDPTPVAASAARHGLDVFAWPRLCNDAFAALSALAPDLCVVAAYGKILPARYLALPRLGCINVHASVLPALRGAAPIQWAVIDGHAETGITVMQMDEGMDTGQTAVVLKTPIGPDETAGELTRRLSILGAEALGLALAKLAQGELTLTKQDHGAATLAPRLHKEHGEIDWRRPAAQVHNLVRGANPWPGARCGELKIHRTAIAEGSGAPGTVIAHDRDGPRVACGEGAVTLLSLQRPGKRIVGGAEFLRGVAVPIGLIL